MRALLLAAAAVLAAGGCNFLGGGIACTAVFVYGVNVSVVDQDGNPVAGAMATLTEGDYSEQMAELRTGEFAGAGERAGTYTLTVEAGGFETVTITDIVVTSDVCHVIPVSRDVTLTAE